MLATSIPMAAPERSLPRYLAHSAPLQLQALFTVDAGGVLGNECPWWFTPRVSPKSNKTMTTTAINKMMSATTFQRAAVICFQSQMFGPSA
jgi:hypothetical protein